MTNGYGSERAREIAEDHPFHPRKGHAANPMRSYESIKHELAGKAKTEAKRSALKAKKK